jgi:hypothetical protein
MGEGKVVAEEAANAVKTKPIKPTGSAAAEAQAFSPEASAAAAAAEAKLAKAAKATTEKAQLEKAAKAEAEAKSKAAAAEAMAGAQTAEAMAGAQTPAAPEVASAVKAKAASAAAPKAPPTVEASPAPRAPAAKPAAKRKGSSQYTGVSLNKTKTKWVATFRSKYLGLFATEEEAARAWNAEAVLVGKPLNVIPPAATSSFPPIQIAPDAAAEAAAKTVAAVEAAEAEVGAEAEADAVVAEFEAEVDDMEVAEDGEEDGEEETAVEEVEEVEEEEEEEEEGVVLGGPVCDSFSALILELRAAGHGGAASADSTAIPTEPAPEFTTFSGLTQTQVRMYLGDVRRTIKKYAATACPSGELPEQLMGAVAVAYLETTAAAKSKKDAFCWGGGEKFAVLLNDTCVKRVLFRDDPQAVGRGLHSLTFQLNLSHV